MTRESTPDKYRDPKEDSLIAGITDRTGSKADNREGREVYDRAAEADWKRTFGVRRAKERPEEGTALDVSNPYPAGSEGSPFDGWTRRHSRLSPEGPVLPILYSESRRNDAQKSVDQHDPARVPIREAMNTIRSILAHVRSVNHISAAEESALNSAYDLLGAAAAQCRIEHNWGELKFIDRVRGLLAAGLGRDQPEVLHPLPRVDLTDTGALAQSTRSPARLEKARSDFDGAGTLVGQLGLAGGSPIDAPRVDVDTAGAVSPAGGTLKKAPALHHLETPRVASVEETGRTNSASLESERTGWPGRWSNLEQIGILISQRERSGKSVT